MSQDFWERHWWLIIVLAAMTVPIIGMLMNAWAQFLYFQHRREALETLKAYTAQGKTPPPEVMEALNGRGRADDPAAWIDELGGNWGGYYGDRYARRAQRAAMRAARWRYREPYRRWNGAVTMTALAVGFAVAARYATPGTADAFILVAIILGAAAVAAVIMAVVATVFRPPGP